MVTETVMTLVVEVVMWSVMAACLASGVDKVLVVGDGAACVMMMMVVRILQVRCGTTRDAWCGVYDDDGDRQRHCKNGVLVTMTAAVLGSSSDRLDDPLLQVHHISTGRSNEVSLGHK